MDAGKNLLLALKAGLKAGQAIMKVYARESFTTAIKADKSPVTEADHLAHSIISNDLATTRIPVLSEEGRDIPWSERRTWKTFWLVDPLDGTKEFVQRNGEFTVNIALVKDNKPLLGIIYAPNDDLMYAAESSLGAWRITDYSTRNIQDFFHLKHVAERLPLPETKGYFAIVASRTHSNQETESFIRSIREVHPDLKIVSRGSALKFCLVAEGSADIYPRMGPTWEWDTGAGQAIAESSGCAVSVYQDGRTLGYNKQVLTNPWFIVKRK
jgi:3'(2'), 5'-bisphosphate nucleotidase